MLQNDAWSTQDSGAPEMPIGKIAGRPDPGKWNEWVMQQSSIWVDYNNFVYLIDQISYRYAYNILRFIWRNARIPTDPTSSPLIMALIRRLSAKDSPYKEVFGQLTYGDIRKGKLQLPA